MFVTQWIEKTLRRRVVFNCGNEQVLLWGPPKEADVKETVERIKHITTHVIDRVDAEFRHLAPFSSFDVLVLREAFACNEQIRARTLQGNLQRHIRNIAQMESPSSTAKGKPNGGPSPSWQLLNAHSCRIALSAV